MFLVYKLLRGSFVVILILSVLGMITLLGAYLFLAPGLPSVSSLKDIKLQVPLRVYSSEGDLLAVYGEKRRKPLTLEEIPPLMQQAFLAAEDDRFFNHPGVDYQGLIRATIHLIRTGEKGQGGSTITMQLARNFFLTRERTYIRKVREIFLAFRIEKELSKEEILELYLNKIYLGHRAYGVGAASEVYYGVPTNRLNLAQVAMIAGLPKAPSTFNPIANPARAMVRRNYVLGRMYALGYIDKEAFDTVRKAPLTAQLHSPVVALDAPFIGEMVRAEMVARYGQEAYTRGLKVVTTVRADLQKTADESLRNGVLAYEQRHGYRGPLGHIDLESVKDKAAWSKILSNFKSFGGLQPALVTNVEDKAALVYLGSTQEITIDWPGLSWARKYINENQRGPVLKTASDALRAGDIIHVHKSPENSWQLAQIPKVAGTLVTLSPDDGAVLALVGGFDFNLSKFNRATQARRQPGSNFKPFIYSAALEKGFTPASLINDAPVVFNDSALEDTWRPENYSGKFFGPTRLRVALTKSRNLVSIRLLHSIGTKHALEYVSRFGFNRELLPNDLSLALGSGLVTPLELVAGYAVFANGGYRVYPHLIKTIKTLDEEIIFEAHPSVVCETPCQIIFSEDNETNPTDTEIVREEPATIQSSVTPADRVITPTNAYQMVSMMTDVVRRGTGKKAMQLGRSDLAGKTGTTNDQIDAWFSGYNRDIVTTVWIGFDKLQSLGNRETGAKAALPIWIDFMRVALQDHPERTLKQPDGMVTVRIDPQTGLIADSRNSNAIFETFRTEFVPSRPAFSNQNTLYQHEATTIEIPEQLF